MKIRYFPNVKPHCMHKTHIYFSEVSELGGAGQVYLSVVSIL